MSLEKALNGIKLIKGLIGDDDSTTGPSDSQLSINKFKGVLDQQHGIAKPNLFMMRILPGPGFWAGPAGSREREANILPSLEFFCESVNMPGVNIIPADYARQGYGVLDRRPINAVVPEVAATFLIDGKGETLQFFRKWMANIVNYDDIGINFNNEMDQLNFSDVRYRNAYLCTIQIFMYSPVGKTPDNQDIGESGQIVQWTGIECWPFTMGDVSLAWGQNDDLARVTVAFQVKSWTNTVSLAQGDDASGQDLGFLDKLLRIGQSVNSLKAAIKKPQHIGDIINVVNTTTGSIRGMTGGHPTGLTSGLGG